MTSQKSSLSTFNFTFWSALKGNFVLPLLNLIALTIIVPVTSAITIKSFSGSSFNPTSSTMETTSSKITDLYKYLIFSEFGQVSSNVFIHLAVIAFSIFFGVVMFRFIASKKTVNVFYSLGITRKNLFVSKYLAGILMLSVSIILPFIACLIVNISTFGSSKELWSAIIYHILGYCAISLTAFSLTAAIFSCVGTIIEGITFSGIIMLGPTVVFYSIQFLMKKLTLGSPYGHYYDSNYQVTNALATTLSRYNPILFLFKNVSKIGFLARESVDSKFVWSLPSYRSTIVWFAVSAALFALGMYLFQKRKAEICGFLGVNKWLNFLTIFLVGFFPLSIAVTNMDSIFAGIALGLLIYTFLYLIIDFALIRNFKEWAKGFVKLPLHLGISLLIVVVFATGLFGFSTRIPRLEKIVSIDIAPVTYTGIVNPLGTNGNGDGDFLFSVGIGNPISGFKTPKDLKTITALHKIIIDTGKLILSDVGTDLPIDEQVTSTAIRISYHLKNGRSVERFYDSAKMKTVTAMLAIDETDRMKALIKQNLTESVSSGDSSELAANKGVFQDEASVISMIPNDLYVSTMLAVTPTLRIELLSALAKDLTAQTVKQRFFPDTPALGTIQFSTSNNPKGEFETMPTGYVNNTMIGLAGYGSTNIIITEDMVNTLSFLEANDWLKYFENNNEFIAAQVISATKIRNDSYYYGSQMSFHFMGGWTKMLNEYGNFIGSYKITDKSLVDEIAANAHISYFNSVKGYFVRFELMGNGGFTTKYIPASKMPQGLMDAVDSHVKVQQQNPNDINKPQ